MYIQRLDGTENTLSKGYFHPLLRNEQSVVTDTLTQRSVGIRVVAVGNQQLSYIRCR
jgi:hypothetical protein